ncbi:MAG: hypothetical protein HY858_14355 [Candidatus Solibacter usitatus]|nr:hypothetical protein [Candidatus Solibacter usitatus]
MRILAFALIALGLPAQQTQSSTYVFDLNGRRSDWTQARSGEGASSETVRDVNGRRVPVEQVQEKILRNEGGVRVVERITKRFDPNGRPLPPEKTVIESTTRADGSGTESVTTYRGDLNGNLQLSERAATQLRKAGDTVTRETSVERAGISGSLEAVERRVSQETVTKTTSEKDETVYSRDSNGRFAEAGRRIVKAATINGQVREQTDEYESVTTGRLQLARTSVATTLKTPDGGERKEVDVYGPAAPGRAVSADGKLQLRERQHFTSRQSADGATVQVFAVQRPNLGAKAGLGPVQTISETVSRTTPAR